MPTAEEIRKKKVAKRAAEIKARNSKTRFESRQFSNEKERLSMNADRIRMQARSKGSSVSGKDAAAQAKKNDDSLRGQTNKNIKNMTPAQRKKFKAALEKNRAARLKQFNS